MKCFIACDRNGYPLARIRAKTKEQAAAVGYQRIVGYYDALEVKSMDHSDIENRLYESFKRMGMSDKYARSAATRPKPSALRIYEAQRDTADSRRQADQFADRYGTNPERKLFEAFRRLGLNDDQARIAVEGRR